MADFFRKNIFVIIIPVIFFVVSLVTISDYGISWDEPIHFTRGQAYLNYFLNGKLNYDGFTGRQSIYQETSFGAQFFLKYDSGHPPVNGILAALSNYIFFQKLGIMGDIESYHLFNIAIATFLVIVVSLFARQTYGNLAAIFAGLSLALYPLFFAESHFNIKDPAEAAFYAATIWAFWNSLRKYNWKWLLAAIFFFALGLGTKFNIIFLPIILILWLFIRNSGWLNLLRIIKLPKKFLIILITSPLIISLIFFLSWPYLWQDSINHLLNIFIYYKEIGTGGLGQPQYITFGGFNLFPITWIAITTPPVMLFFTILGVVAALSKVKEKEKTALLFLFWLFIPILRVSLPGSSIYGGVRQIMEFIPAMALLTGLGVVFFLDSLKKFSFFKKPVFFAPALALVLFIPSFLTLVKMHPNQNVYFNLFVGGLPGAKEKNIPYWGNSFGNAYYQAAKWINKNAKLGSKVGLIQGTKVNIPILYFSPEVSYSNSSWSGINRWGEYLVELTHQGNEIAYPFAWEYVNKVLVPVYEVKVDGVSIAKVWKNDMENSRVEFKEERNLIVESVAQRKGSLVATFPREFTLARLIVEFDSNINCTGLSLGTIESSLNGVDWVLEPEKLTDQQVVSYPTLEKEKIHYIFPARLTKYIRINTGNEKSCLFNNTRVVAGGFD